MILGYIRVSTETQAKEDRSSLQTQTDVIEGFARTRGVDRFGVQIFTDAGVSGATKFASRPAGADLLKAVQAGDTVIASKLDRMFRSMIDALNMIEEFRARGVHLVLFDMGNESVLESGVSKFLFTVLAAVADMERDRIKERTMEGRKAKRAKGGVLGGIPFGYRKVGEGRSAVLEPDEVEQQAIDVIRANRGRPYPEIVRHLDSLGFKSRTGSSFTPMAVCRVLHRETAQ